MIICFLFLFLSLLLIKSVSQNKIGSKYKIIYGGNFSIIWIWCSYYYTLYILYYCRLVRYTIRYPFINITWTSYSFRYARPVFITFHRLPLNALNIQQSIRHAFQTLRTFVILFVSLTFYYMYIVNIAYKTIPYT